MWLAVQTKETDSRTVSEISITNHMPAFASAEATEAIGEVTEVSNDWRGYSVKYLTPQQQVAGQRVMEVDDILEEDDQQREPHGSTQVVMDVPDAVQ